jgi:hypothetical protein
LNFLDIDIPAAAGGLARPRAIVAKLRAAATLLALCHILDSFNLYRSTRHGKRRPA